VEQDRKIIQACGNQQIRKWQKIDIFLLFQVLWHRRNTIVTIVSYWWLSIFYSQHGHWRSCQWSSQPKTLGQQMFDFRQVANPKLWGSKCLTSGKQQHFCLGHHFSKHKMTGYAKIWSVCLPWLCLCVLHCLFFMRILHTQLFFTYFHEYMFISPKWY